MDFVSFILSVVLFAAFVPGFLFRFPKHSSYATVLVVHALLFAVVVSLVMSYYWTGRLEFFGNYGATCPNGYIAGTNQAGRPDCVPAGHATYDTLKPNSPAK